MSTKSFYKNVDLHMHSVHSDGSLTAVELIALAKERGVDCLSITDHDSLNGYNELIDLYDAIKPDGLSEKESDSHLKLRRDIGRSSVSQISSLKDGAAGEGIDIVVGCEFSAVWRGKTVHILGLNLDLSSATLSDAMRIQSDARLRRSRRIADILEKKGFSGALNAAIENADGAVIGRPHFAQFLVDKGYVKDAKQAFKKYLGAGKAGDIKAEWPDIEQVCRWIIDSGGVAVIAHPLKYGLTQTKLRALLGDFVEYGGRGIEVISGCQDNEKTKVLARLAKQFGLVASVGSDFHHPGMSWAELGRAPMLPPSCQPVWELWAG